MESRDGLPPPETAERLADSRDPEETFNTNQRLAVLCQQNFQDFLDLLGLSDIYHKHCSSGRSTKIFSTPKAPGKESSAAFRRRSMKTFSIPKALRRGITGRAPPRTTASTCPAQEPDPVPTLEDDLGNLARPAFVGATLLQSQREPSTFLWLTA